MKLLNDAQKHENNKDLMIRLHKELHKTTSLKSKLNALMTLINVAFTTEL